MSTRTPTTNTPDARRYRRDAAVSRGEMIEAKEGETMRLSRGHAEIIKPILAAKIARIEWLSDDNHEDRHPNFVRLLAKRQVTL